MKFLWNNTFYHYTTSFTLYQRTAEAVRLMGLFSFCTLVSCITNPAKSQTEIHGIAVCKNMYHLLISRSVPKSCLVGLLVIVNKIDGSRDSRYAPTFARWQRSYWQRAGGNDTPLSWDDCAEWCEQAAQHCRPPWPACPSPKGESSSPVTA